MEDNRFSGTGDTVPTHFSDPAPFGDFLAAATGADEELGHAERRRQERPRLTLEFERTEDREQFVTALLMEEFEPRLTRKPVWRLVALWSLGEGSL
jgi:hypothetical protein